VKRGASSETAAGRRQPGGGTRFHVTLPLAATTSAPEPAAPPPEVTMPEPYTVPDALASTDPEVVPVAGPGSADADRAALERGLAATGPSARELSAARLPAPVPDHHHGD
jgi:hypothetical protein